MAVASLRQVVATLLPFQGPFPPYQPFPAVTVASALQASCRPCQPTSAFALEPSGLDRIGLDTSDHLHPLEAFDRCGLWTV